MSLPDRRESDESLTTDKLWLEHRMGDPSAVAKLVRLADTNPDWYEPSQSLASIYYSLGSYDKASAHLKAAKNRARDDAQRIRSVLLDARIREQTEGPRAAIHLLKASLDEFPEQQYKAQIWKRVAELHWSSGEKIPSFIAAEIALQTQPLDKDLRFHLAYRYADSETTKSLAYYHYDKLRDQDERHPYCLNNMAIILQDLDMSVGYVRLLKRAKEFDQPYPHGNLAIALAKAGFLDEARAMIEELPEKLRLESRAAEAADFIARKQTAEAKMMRKLERASELFHKIHLTAAVNVSNGRVTGVKNVVGTWASGSCDLSLEEGAAPKWLVGTLRKAGGEYSIKLQLTDNLMTGEATKKGERLGLLSGPTTHKMLLTGESEGKMIGLIYTDEMDPTEVTLVRQE